MIRKTLTAAILAASVFAFSVAAGCQPAPLSVETPAYKTPSASTFKAGDSVVAVWSGPMWYEGTVNGPCATGVEVKWTDGSAPSCVTESSIRPNKNLLAGNVKVGDKVLAQWTGNSFYVAEVTKADSGTYSVKYTSDSATKDGLTLSQLRAY